MRSVILVTMALALLAPMGAHADGVYGPADTPKERSAAISALTDAGDVSAGAIWFLKDSESLLDGELPILGFGETIRCSGEPLTSAMLMAEAEALLNDPSGVALEAHPLMKRVSASVACLDAFVQPDVLFRLFATRALHSWRAKEFRATEDAIRSAVLLDPLARWPGDAWEELERTFLEVRTGVRAEGDVTGFLAAEGLEVRIDGVGPTDGSWTLKAGGHLVQVSDGTRVDSRWVTVAAPFAIGTPSGLWKATHEGLTKVAPGDVSEPAPMADAVRLNLAKLHESQVILEDLGRTYTIETGTGQVRGSKGRRGQGRWRPRPSLGVGAGWWGFSVRCAPTLNPTADRGAGQRSTGPLVSGWCRTNSKLLYPLPSDHWAALEVSTGLHIHVLALHFAVAVGLSPATNDPFKEVGSSGSATSNPPWAQSRLRWGIGVESPKGPVRLGMRLEATAVPAGNQIVLAYEDGGDGVAVDVSQTRRFVLFLGGGLAATASFRVARTPLWFRVEGAAGVAGVAYGSVLGALEFRAP
ncbi:MAG: hypothetical protein KDA24_28380 [Deltaproteobacteria bacterium]|nr:hypothetical protein [Deltaproteobacteria bacterium]